MISRQATITRSLVYTNITYILSCFLAVLVMMTSATQNFKRTIMEDASYSVDVDGLNQLLESLDNHLENFQKRTCAVGLMSHNCALSDLDKVMRAKAFLSSGFSPGKRSSPSVATQGAQVVPREMVDEAKALQDDIMKQRKIIWRLKTLLHDLRRTDAEHDVRNQKRSCRFRLGGHCLTEELDRAASQFYYLQSPDSPGKRRRRSTKSGVGAILAPGSPNYQLASLDKATEGR